MPTDTDTADAAALVDGFPADNFQNLFDLVRALNVLRNARESTGTVPSDKLQYIRFGDASDYRKYRVGYDGTLFVVEKNTGSDASPSWAWQIRLTESSGKLEINGAQFDTNGGDIDLAGGALLNVLTINSVDVSAHGSRHLPAGADPLTTAAPVSPGTANAAGSANAFARSDHVHRAIASLDGNASGSPEYGDLNLQQHADGYLTIAQTAGQFEFRYIVPDREYKRLNEAHAADTVTAATETIVQTGDGSPDLLQIQMDGADGAKKYRLSFAFTVENQHASVDDEYIVRVRMGAAGTVADASQRRYHFMARDAADVGDQRTFSLSGIQLVPAANDYVTITIESAAQDVDVLTSQEAAEMEAVEIQE